MGIERDLSRDGTEIRFTVPYYMHSRLVLPNEQWRLIGSRCVRPSWLDGESIQLWLVRSERSGRGALVEPWQLSLVPIDEMLRRLAPERPPPSAPTAYFYPPPVMFDGVPRPGPRSTA